MADVPEQCDLAVVGGGIVGLSVARELTRRRPGLSAVVLERGATIATGQTGANSGVIHAGIYYVPGSLKARLCVEGALEMYEYCEQQGIEHERCGKVIVARDESELGRLDELERRGHANGVPGLRRLSRAQLNEIEPHCRGVGGLHSPATGIVNFADVAAALARELEASGTPVVTSCGVEDVHSRPGRVGLSHTRGETQARFAVFCAGVGSDRLAVAAGAPPDPRIVPFRGAYLYLRPERRDLVRSLIYPVPDPSLPFLGVHLSRHIDGQVSLGPTALLAPRSPGDLVWPGTLRMARRWWRTGITEIRHAASRRALARAAADYVPDIGPGDFDGGFAGKRAQALGRDGKLVDDFVVSETERALHVRNAPSPAATSSLALARLIADRAEPGLD
ncbi:MAG: (S)-2-hydroxyglutarate dehydrogenase [Thermoleophilaceae bacterium]|jgi:2-hydroxyglutarate dehydrogenase|nr:(S)-2-hydroxyglutarate dehydrogenase [Thermoleophilaceae bacterium]